MLIKTLQWNIGGAYIRNKDDNPEEAASYANFNIDYIAEVIARFDPDIATFQETHADNTLEQIAYLAEKLSYKYFHNDTYDDSHIEKGQRLGQGVLSKFEITEKSFSLYENPNLEIIRPSGGKWVTHDKGVSKFKLKAGEHELILKTSHAVPFRKFGSDFLAEEMKHIRDDVVAKILPVEQLELLQGDFNYNHESLKPLFPELFDDGLDEFLTHAPTTPKQNKYDHIAFKGMKPVKFEIISNTLTDHYPLYSELEII